MGGWRPCLASGVWGSRYPGSDQAAGYLVVSTSFLGSRWTTWACSKLRSTCAFEPQPSRRSARPALPASLMMAGRLGKMPTTSVRRLIGRLNRSLILSSLVTALANRPSARDRWHGLKDLAQGTSLQLPSGAPI